MPLKQNKTKKLEQEAMHTYKFAKLNTIEPSGIKFYSCFGC